MKLWIARDKNGLFLYTKKPMFFEGLNEFGCMIGEEFCELPSNWFLEVTFENSPQEVELKLKNELSFEEMEELIDDLI